MAKAGRKARELSTDVEQLVDSSAEIENAADPLLDPAEQAQTQEEVEETVAEALASDPEDEEQDIDPAQVEANAAQTAEAMGELIDETFKDEPPLEPINEEPPAKPKRQRVPRKDRPVAEAGAVNIKAPAYYPFNYVPPMCATKEAQTAVERIQNSIGGFSF